MGLIFSKHLTSTLNFCYFFPDNRLPTNFFPGFLYCWVVFSLLIYFENECIIQVTTLVSEVETLKKDKEHLRINLNRAEEELLNREIHSQGSGSKYSAIAPAKGKRKSSPLEKAVEFNGTDLSRQPLSPLQQNSPDSRMHKK
ncbi:unnamed protein product [Spirodela intermedia]|uniref:Uncharacterized protein n=1 Tax=Spirodela intermedia TaxID=51605 RepID=A0ABN7ECJ0_SPIIN|nr:unnamed protein product [Spirodela intermedia]